MPETSDFCTCARYLSNFTPKATTSKLFKCNVFLQVAGLAFTLIFSWTTLRYGGNTLRSPLISDAALIPSTHSTVRVNMQTVDTFNFNLCQEQFPKSNLRAKLAEKSNNYSGLVKVKTTHTSVVVK